MLTKPYLEAPWRDSPETPAGDWLSVPKRKTDRRVEPGILRQLAAELPGMLAGARDVYQEQQAVPSMTVPTTPGLSKEVQLALLGQYAGQDRARAAAAQQALSRRDAEQRMDRQEQREDERWTRQEQQAEARQRQGRLYQVTVPTEDGGTRTEWRSIGLDPETNAPMDYGSILGPEQPGKQGPVRAFSPGQMLMQPDGTWAEVPYPDSPPPAWAQRGRAASGSGGQARAGAAPAGGKMSPTQFKYTVQGMPAEAAYEAAKLYLSPEEAELYNPARAGGAGPVQKRHEWTPTQAEKLVKDLSEKGPLRVNGPIDLKYPEKAKKERDDLARKVLTEGWDPVNVFSFLEMNKGVDRLEEPKDAAPAAQALPPGGTWGTLPSGETGTMYPDGTFIPD